MELKLVVHVYSVCLHNPFNRTLWNWNHFLRLQHANTYLLLIVPYGIETYLTFQLRTMFVCLLIVPYGIETHLRIFFNSVDPSFNRTLWDWNYQHAYLINDNGILLIVPYGIETFYRCSHPFHRASLLIVPYGIETSDIGHDIHHREAFNRTLWNWNFFANWLKR